MKTIIISFAACFSFSAFAGGTGGGGVLRGVMAVRSPVVYTYEVSEAGAKFAYGTLVNDQWRVESFEIQDTHLHSNPELLKALKQSLELQGWISFQN